jgi:hypothetical protein
MWIPTPGDKRSREPSGRFGPAKRRKVILFQITEALAPNRFKDCWRD